jgi:hypothetical protein
MAAGVDHRRHRHPGNVAEVRRSRLCKGKRFNSDLISSMLESLIFGGSRRAPRLDRVSDCWRPARALLRRHGPLRAALWRAFRGQGFRETPIYAASCLDVLFPWPVNVGAKVIGHPSPQFVSTASTQFNLAL